MNYFDLKMVAGPLANEASASLKILVIALNFPPDGEVGAKRIAAFCRYLPEFGIQPVVLTVDERFYRVVDESVSVPQGIPVVRTSIANPLHWYRRLRFFAHRNPSASGSSYGLPSARRKQGFFRQQLLTLLDTPDEYWGWYFPAIRAAKKLIQTEPIAAVLSTAPPWTPHLIARYIKKKYHIPWFADFRDPWTSDPWRGCVPQWRQRIDRRLESTCLRWTDIVLCVTDGIRTDFAEQYPASAGKFVTLSNGFDGSNSNKPRTISQNSQRLLLHLGSLYGGRRIEPFCQAMVDLTRSGRINPGNTKVLFVGENDAGIIAAAQRVAPELLRNNCIEFRPRVPWGEAQVLLQTADVLLIFQGQLRSRIPAKFYEYLQTGKPIFAMAAQGDLSAILKATCSGVAADPSDPRDIASKFVDMLDLPGRSSEEVGRLAQLYHFRSISRRLADLISHSCGRLTSTPNYVS